MQIFLLNEYNSLTFDTIKSYPLVTNVNIDILFIVLEDRSSNHSEAFSTVLSFNSISFTELFDIFFAKYR